MSSAAVTATEQPEYEPKTLSYRFRKAWRAVLFVALVPFFQPGLITSLLPVSVPQDIVKFFAGVLVLVPLSTFIEVVTEDLIERLGQLIGGLLHAFFGNVAYFVLTATALYTAATLPPSALERGHIITIVESSIAGNILIDILFILGVSIFIGGMRNGRMQFSAEYSNQYAEMLLIAIIALALPTLAQKGISLGLADKAGLSINSGDVLILSDVTAVILIVAYIGYLGWTVFKFRDMQSKVENPAEVREALRGDEIGPFAIQADRDESARQAQQYAALEAAATLKRSEPQIPPSPASRDASTIANIVNARLERESRERNAPARPATSEAAKERNRGIAIWELAILIAGTAGVVFISENMAKVFEGDTLTKALNLNDFFVGLILLPVASNLVELSAAVSAAFHNRMETCLAVTAGSAIQVALLIAPLLVLVSHLVGLSDFKLIFSTFVLAIFALVAYLFQIVTVDGETTWLEGLQFSSFFAVVVAVALLAGP